jgi:hypothetical protein
MSSVRNPGARKFAHRGLRGAETITSEAYRSPASSAGLAAAAMESATPEGWTASPSAKNHTSVPNESMTATASIADIQAIRRVAMPIRYSMAAKSIR